MCVLHVFWKMKIKWCKYNFFQIQFRLIWSTTPNVTSRTPYISTYSGFLNFALTAFTRTSDLDTASKMRPAFHSRRPYANNGIMLYMYIYFYSFTLQKNIHSIFLTFHPSLPSSLWNNNSNLEDILKYQMYYWNIKTSPDFRCGSCELIYIYKQYIWM